LEIQDWLYVLGRTEKAPARSKGLVYSKDQRKNNNCRMDRGDVIWGQSTRIGKREKIAEPSSTTKTKTVKWKINPMDSVGKKQGKKVCPLGRDTARTETLKVGLRGKKRDFSYRLSARGRQHLNCGRRAGL